MAETANPSGGQSYLAAAREIRKALGDRISEKTVLEVIKLYDNKSIRKKTNPKHKGSGYEWEICKLLDTWWQVPPDTFVPTRVSGGWGKLKKFTPTSLEPGDVTSRIPELTRDFPFVIEIKSEEGWDLHCHLEQDVRKIHLLFAWWDKLVGETEPTGKVPLLITKKAYRPPLAIFDVRSKPPESKSLPVFRQLELTVVSRNSGEFRHTTPIFTLVGVPLKEFFGLSKEFVTAFKSFL